jgi:hypothetical protein
MSNREKGSPAGANKSEGTGTPADKFNDNLERDQELTEKYTDGKDGLAEHVREINPNRNVDKEDATNAGGYKN